MARELYVNVRRGLIQTNNRKEEEEEEEEEVFTSEFMEIEEEYYMKTLSRYPVQFVKQLQKYTNPTHGTNYSSKRM
jgi:hypothetical protein